MAIKETPGPGLTNTVINSASGKPSNPLRGYSSVHDFSTFKQSKHRIKMVALMLALSTTATAEEKINTCTHRRRTTGDHNLFQKIRIHILIKTYHDQHRAKRGQENLESEVFTGSLTSTYN